VDESRGMAFVADIGLVSALDELATEDDIKTRAWTRAFGAAQHNMMEGRA